MAPTPGRASDPRRILVVTSKPIPDSLLRLEPVVSLTGREAMSRFRSETPWHAVLVDPILPDMTGIELIRSARRFSNDTVFILLDLHGCLEGTCSADGIADPAELTAGHIDQAIVRRQEALLQLRRPDTISENEARLHAMLGALQDPLFTLDLEGRCVSFYWGRAERFGIKPENVVGRTVRELFDPALAQALHRQLVEVFESRRSQTQEHAIAFGRWTLQFEITLNPLFSPDRAVHAVVGIAHDVTQQRIMEKRIQQNARLDLAGRLAAAFAHDFNNILSGILLKTDLALSMAHGNEELKKELAEVRMESLLGAEMTRRLLGLVRRERPDSIVMDLDETIESMLPMVRHLLTDAIELRHRRTPGLWTIRADSSQIEQVIFNLALNARDAMPRGGRLTIETGNIVLDESYARSNFQRRGGDYVVLSVCDSGQGMDEEVKSHLFEPFYSTKAHGLGAGLGLACVRDISQQHDAAILVHSQPGRGTRIDLYFPRIQIKEPSLQS